MMTAEEALRWARTEILSLCEATEDDPHLVSLLPEDRQGKHAVHERGYARGRIHEAKGIRRAMAEVIRVKLEELAL